MGNRNGPRWDKGRLFVRQRQAESWYRCCIGQDVIWVTGSAMGASTGYQVIWVERRAVKQYNTYLGVEGKASTGYSIVTCATSMCSVHHVAGQPDSKIHGPRSSHAFNPSDKLFPIHVGMEDLKSIDSWPGLTPTLVCWFVVRVKPSVFDTVCFHLKASGALCHFVKQKRRIVEVMYLRDFSELGSQPPKRSHKSLKGKRVQIKTAVTMTPPIQF